MKRIYIYIFVVVSIIAALVGIYFLIKAEKAKAPQSTSQNSQPPINSPTTPPTITPPADTSPPTTTPAQPAATLFYPIDNYATRLAKNFFGSYYSSQSPQTIDSTLCPGAAVYTGYHTGDDLETTLAEQSVPVAVKSIADGKVLQIGTVTGYGGLIVIEYTLNNNNYTAYYGHINLATAMIKKNDVVTPNEKIAELAQACSSQNNNVRKHLHFALHLGSSIDVRGYAPDKNTLSNWVDPKLLLTSLSASN